MAILDWQKHTRQLHRDNDKELVGHEQNMLREQWAIEEQKEKQNTEQ